MLGLLGLQTELVERLRMQKLSEWALELGKALELVLESAL